MLKPENQVDKQRFEKLKDTQVARGRDEDDATQVAADEVKEMRRREGRSKDDVPPSAVPPKNMPRRN
jgi:hypothetical protein